MRAGAAPRRERDSDSTGTPEKSGPPGGVRPRSPDDQMMCCDDVARSLRCVGNPALVDPRERLELSNARIWPQFLVDGAATSVGAADSTRPHVNSYQKS
jgi:hypothetical protein